MNRSARATHTHTGLALTLFCSAMMLAGYSSNTFAATLQEQINAAPAGGTVVVPAGTHVGALVVNKALTLTTANPTSPNKPVIDGNGATNPDK